MTAYLFAASLALIVAGVAWIYAPAALIVAGGLLGASAWRIEATRTRASSGSRD